MSGPRSPWRRLAPVLLLLGAACSGIDRQRIMADRATFEWFAPLFTRYVLADPTLDEAARATHLRGLEAWDERIRADEEGLAMPLPVPAPPEPR